MAMNEQQLEAFLRQPLVAVLATLDPDGTPHQVPIWYLWEDGTAYMFTGRRSRKWRNLQRDPRASLCIDHREQPYAAVIVSGEVEETDRALYDVVLPMALSHYGEERGRSFAEGYRASPGSVAFRLVPRSIRSWDYSEGD